MYRDDRGWGLYDVFPMLSEGQINVSMSYPGVVRAFHLHRKQTDYWTVVQGNLEVCLVPEVGVKELHYLSVGDRLAITPNIWHGFKVLGNEPATLLYYVTGEYDPKNPDEERRNWDYFYDWKTKNR
jgi:dTDP-4-dehydrorhamnose 3,5-epimerase